MIEAFNLLERSYIGHSAIRTKPDCQHELSKFKNNTNEPSISLKIKMLDFLDVREPSTPLKMLVLFLLTQQLTGRNQVARRARKRHRVAFLGLDGTGTAHCLLAMANASGADQRFRRRL